MSGDCGHGWGYHSQGASGPCDLCVAEQKKRDAFVDEAMRLADAMRELLELEADGKHADESSIEYWERARAALAAYLKGTR